MPGSARGAAHTTFLVVLASVMMFGVGMVCYGELRSKLDDPVVASKRATELVSAASPTVFSAAVVAPGVAAPASRGAIDIKKLLGASSDREIVERFLGHEQMGYLYLLAVLGLTVVAVSQITWRISLSGLSKSISGVLAGLIIGAWVVVPMIVEGVMSRNVRDEERTVAQFSPVWAGVNAWAAGKATAMKSVSPQGSGDYLRHEQRADGFNTRLWTYLIATGVIAGGFWLSMLFRTARSSEWLRAPQRRPHRTRTRTVASLPCLSRQLKHRHSLWLRSNRRCPQRLWHPSRLLRAQRQRPTLRPRRCLLSRLHPSAV